MQKDTNLCDSLQTVNVFSPSLEVVDGLLHAFLVVADHVLVHVGVVGTDVLLGAAVGHGAKPKWWVLLRGLLELHRREMRRLKMRSQRMKRS